MDVSGTGRGGANNGVGSGRDSFLGCGRNALEVAGSADRGAGRGMDTHYCCGDDESSVENRSTAAVDVDF